MKGKIKWSYLVFVLVFCLSLCTIKVFATDDDLVIETDPPVVTEPAPVVTTPPTQAPTAAPVVTKAPTQAPTKAQVVTQAPTQAQTAAPATRATAAQNNQTNNNSNSNSNYSSNNSNNAERYNYTAAATSAATAAVYDTDDDVDTEALNKKDWKSIVKALKSANSDENGEAAEDFGWIQKNEGGSDNGDWMLYTAIGMLSAGALIIVLLIVFAVHRRNKVKKHLAAAGDSSSVIAPTGRPPQRKAPADPKGARKRSKFDTAEIRVPKKRGNNGTRYRR